MDRRRRAAKAENRNSLGNVRRDKGSLDLFGIDLSMKEVARATSKGRYEEILHKD